MRKSVTRTIYNNYDLWDDCVEDAREYLREEHEIENPSDDELWDEINFMDELNWEDVICQLESFFDNGTFILTGIVGRWNGNFAGGFLFSSFKDMWYKATKDCDYVHIYDENGHFYIKCSHHDGTNMYEIKKLTEKGIEYYDNWEYGDDKRTEQYVHNKIMTNSKYAVLPNFYHKVYGCPKVEYEKQTA